MISFLIIKNIILIYKATDDDEILNFIIDQYSSKYDHKKNIFIHSMKYVSPKIVKAD